MQTVKTPLSAALSEESVDVLYAEDDDGYARFVSVCLKRAGLTLRRLQSRAELLSYLLRCQRPPRCLLLDLTLGDARGFVLCDEVKRSPAFQLLPIVIITGSVLKPGECLKHGVLHCVVKGRDEGLLAGVLSAVIAQHERSQGIVDVDDLRIDPQERKITLSGEPVAQLAPGPFAALLLLIKSAPNAVPDENLYEAFLERHPYHHNDDARLSVRRIVKNYVSRLRQELGPAGARIARLRNEGYVYRFSEQ